MAKDLNTTKQESTPSTSNASSLGLSSSSEEVEKSEDVNQGKAPFPTPLVAPELPTAPVLVLSSGLEVASNLAFPLVISVVGDEIEYSFNVGANSNSSIEMELKPKDIALKKKGKGASSKIVLKNSYSTVK